MTCGKTQGFLAKAKIDTAEQVDAKKVRMGPEQALGLLKEVDELYVAKGAKVVGNVVGGSFSGGPGNITIELALADTASVPINLIGARATAGVIANGTM